MPDGGAIGDALGYPVEFLSTMRIKKNYGEEGIRSLKINNGVACFSDDTQMTLFTAEGLLKAKERGVTLKKSIYLSYLDWLKTQYEVSPVSDKGLLSVATLYDRRAPGITCLSALNSGLEGGISQSINDSKGCGGVMRTAPVALFCYARGANALGADELAAEAAAITHSHVLGHLPSYALNHILYEILGGADLSDAINRAIEATETRYACDEGAALGISKMRIATMLAEHPTASDDAAISMLGEGWVAEEALAISIYCALKHKDNFLDAIIAAVNHDGDSDSTGAITGNIIGAYLGYKAIPMELSDPIEAKDVILEISDALL
jgi:ADP-ribosylglycohydrolase